MVRAQANVVGVGDATMQKICCPWDYHFSGTHTTKGMFCSQDKRSLERKIADRNFGCEAGGTNDEVMAALQYEEGTDKEGKKKMVLDMLGVKEEDGTPTYPKYTATIKSVSCPSGDCITDWGDKTDEVRFVLQCVTSKRETKGLDSFSVSKSTTLKHPRGDIGESSGSDFAYCGLASIACDHGEALKVWIFEDDQGSLANLITGGQECNDDVGMLEIPWKTIEIMFPGMEKKADLLPLSVGTADKFWDAFWVYQEKICLTDFVPYLGKAAKAAKLSQKTIKRLEKFEEAVDKADKVLEYGKLGWDGMACEMDVACTQFHVDVQHAQKCELERSNCLGGTSAKDFIEGITDTQCIGPPDEFKPYTAIIQFMPGDSPAKKEQPDYKSTYGDKFTGGHDPLKDTSWLDCSQCPCNCDCKESEVQGSDETKCRMNGYPGARCNNRNPDLYGTNRDKKKKFCSNTKSGVAGSAVSSFRAVNMMLLTMLLTGHFVRGM